jgi:hypothetical protein
MRAKSCLTALAIVSALLVATSVRDASAEDAGAPALPACIGVNTTSRYVPYGYNHVVILKNGCSKAATCTVSTDVNPTPTSVDVAISTTIEVLTFNASPQQNFVAHVTCKLH